MVWNKEVLAARKQNSDLLGVWWKGGLWERTCSDKRNDWKGHQKMFQSWRQDHLDRHGLTNLLQRVRHHDDWTRFCTFRFIWGKGASSQLPIPCSPLIITSQHHQVNFLFIYDTLFDIIAFSSNMTFFKNLGDQDKMIERMFIGWNITILIWNPSTDVHYACRFNWKCWNDFVFWL